MIYFGTVSYELELRIASIEHLEDVRRRVAMAMSDAEREEAINNFDFAIRELRKSTIYQLVACWNVATPRPKKN